MRPPADALVCAERPANYAGNDTFQLPPAVRAWLKEFAAAAGRNADRQDRLVNFHKPGSC